MYKVVKDFTDKNDGHIYRVGDAFPLPGVKASRERIAELSTTANASRSVLIERVDEPKRGKRNAGRGAESD